MYPSGRVCMNCCTHEPYISNFVFSRQHSTSIISDWNSEPKIHVNHLFLFKWLIWMTIWFIIALDCYKRLVCIHNIISWIIFSEQQSAPVRHNETSCSIMWRLALSVVPYTGLWCKEEQRVCFEWWVALEFPNRKCLRWWMAVFPRRKLWVTWVGV